MPRDQETSLRHDSATSDDPLFRDRSGPTPPDQDDYATTGSTPIGDELAATHHDGPDADVTDTPGEWVAGSKGPGYAPGDDQEDPATLAEPVDPADANAAGTGGSTDLRATRDPEVAPDAALAADPLAAQGATATQDTGVTPDSETTPANGIPVVTSADAPPAGATAADGTAADVPADAGVTDTGATATGASMADIAPTGTTPTGTPSDTTTTPATATPADTTTPAETAAPAAADGSATAPATPVPGAPGTVPSTGVDAAVAAFVTNGDELHAEWVRIQSSFVDDPRGSVAQAADLVSQVTNSLVTAVQQREQALRGTWDSQGGGDTDTEHLRNAFRDYRSFFERLAQL